MTDEMVLRGLNGRNPMAYFAALGTLFAVARMRPEASPRLHWLRRPIPRAVLTAHLPGGDLIEVLDADRAEWFNCVALRGPNEVPFEDVKLSAIEQRRYLLACRDAADGGRSAGLASALVAEGSFAGKGDGKPTDLHFTAGQQRFLSIARVLQDQVTRDDLSEAVLGPWSYRKALPTFKWDVSDDRVYALSASDPSKETKYTVPGADWLALVGLSAYSAIRDGGRSRPPGSGGTWKYGRFRWGLWSEPLEADAVRASVATGWDPDFVGSQGIGAFRVLEARVRRSDQGGYGSFSPSSVIWEGAARSDEEPVPVETARSQAWLN